MNSDDDSAIDADKAFPVAPRPPRSHYWPKKSRQQRSFDLTVKKLCLEVLAANPDLNKPQYGPLILRYARALILHERAWLHLCESPSLSLLNDKDNPRGALVAYQMREKKLQELAQELGLTAETETSARAKALRELEAFGGEE